MNRYKKNLPELMEEMLELRNKSVKARKCAFCGTSINLNSFRDDLSRKEFSISGLCQKCMDSVFGKE